MFFSYGNTEARDAGYREAPGFRDYFVNTEEKADALRNKTRELLDQGHKVIIGYERLAYGGGEGYVTLMVKEWFLPIGLKRTFTRSSYEIK